MIKHYSYIFFILFCLFFNSILTLKGQEKKVIFKKLNLENGLSSNNVYDVVEDEQGFIWIATLEGLDRFDGVNIKHYLHQPQDSTSIPSNQIFRLFLDKKKRLWVGSRKGLSLYLPESDNFKNFPQESNLNPTADARINHIVEDKNGLFWFWQQSKRALSLFDPQSGKIIHELNNTASSIIRMAKQNLDFFLVDIQNRLWFCINQKVYCVAYDKHQMRLVYQLEGDFKSSLKGEGNPTVVFESSLHKIYIANRGLFQFEETKDAYALHHHNILGNPKTGYEPDFFIHHINEDAQNNLWISTRDHGLIRYHPLTKKIKKYNTNNSAIENNIQKTKIDAQGNVWVFSVNHLYRYLSNKDDFEVFTNQRPDDQSISQCKFEEIIDDQLLLSHNGIYWLNTYNYGVNYFNLSAARFESYYKEDKKSTSLLSNRIWGLCEDHKGRIWIGNSLGISMYDPHSRKMQHFSAKHDPNLKYLTTIVMAICEVSPNNFLVSVSGRLVWYEYKNGQLHRKRDYRPELGKANSLISWSPQSIFKDKQGFIWIGTTVGISRFQLPSKLNPQGLFKNYQPQDSQKNSLPERLIRGFYEDQAQRLWIFSESKLCFLDKDRKHFTEVVPIVNGNILEELAPRGMLEEADEKYWIASEYAGLIYYDKKSDQFKQYTTEQGLPTNKLFSIFKDEQGYLWMSSNRGLVRFDPKTKKSWLFNQNDGLVSNEFIYGAAHQGKKSEKIYIGSNNGVNAFHPSNIWIAKSKPEIALTSLRLSNKEIKPNEKIHGRVLLPKAINFVQKISLAYYENIFTIEFVALNFYNPQKTQYKYWLEGFEDKPSQVSNQNPRVNYTGLPPGNYTLHIQSTNADGIWQQNERLLEIIIYPPWWQTWWFKSLMVFLIALACITYYKMRLSNYKKRQKELQRIVKEKTNQLQVKSVLLDQHNKNLELIIGIGQKLTASTEAQDIIREVYKEVNELMDAAIFSIGIINHKKSAIEYWTYKEGEGSIKFGEVSLSDEDRLSVWCLRNSQTVVMNDVEKQSQQYLGKIISSYTDQGRPKSAIYLPMYDHNRAIMGILNVKSLHKNAYTTKDVDFLRSLVSYIAIAMDNASAYQTIKVQEESKTRFFDNVSHEFKTPLTLIKAPLHRALKNNTVRKEVGEELLLIKRNARHLEKMIGQLLTLRSLEKGTEKLNLSKSNLFNFCQNIYQSFYYLAHQKGLILIFDANKCEECQAYFDRDKLEKILYNLLSNAIKFTNKDGTVVFKLNLNHKKAEIVIRDSGIGIKKEDQKKIFDRFYTKNNQNAGGTGIGLALVKELIEIHQGTIQLSSEEGIGSQFILNIPIDVESYQGIEIENIPDFSQDEIEAAPESDNNLGSSEITSLNNFKKTKKLLIVEDNVDIRKFLRLSLSKDFNVFEANNGKEGYELAQKEYPDIILSDIMMPIMDGISFCKKLKSDVRLSHIPVVMLTAQASESKQLEGLKLGADDYIVKPFNQEFVRLKITNWIKTLEQQKKKFGESSFQELFNLSTNPTDHDFLKQAIKTIQQQIKNSEFGNDDFVSKMGMSRTNLYRKLKGLTGKSLSEFITSVKMKYAKELLQQDNMNVSQVAYTLGYDIPAHFTRAFKNEFGITPSKLIALHKKD